MAEFAQPVPHGLDIRPITADDTIFIRHTVLWPHKHVGHVRLPEDDYGLHFGAFLQDVKSGEHAPPIAAISLFHEDVPGIYDARDGVAWRFRKFACLPAHQGRGVGSALLRYVLEHARDKLDARVVWCDARTAEAGWYERRGLVAFGETFMKSEVEYIRMSIAL